MDQDAANWTTVASMAGLHSLEQWGSRVTAWTHLIVAPRVDVQLPLIDVSTACDRVFLQVTDAGDWRELRDCSTELRFLSLHAERLVEAMRAEYGNSRAIGAAINALERVRRDLSEVTPAPRHRHGFGTSFVAMRNSLYDAIWQLRYGLLVLGWAHLEKSRELTLGR